MASYTGLYSPENVDDSTIANYELENTPSERTTVAGEDAVEGLKVGLFGQALRKGADFQNQIADAAGLPITPNKQLTEEEWKNSDNFRPGIKYSPGFNERLAKIKAEAFDSEQGRQENLARLPGGALSFAARTIGSIVGFVGGNLGVTGPVTNLIGLGAGKTLNALANISKPLARVAEGSLIGAGITAPQEITRALNSYQTGEEDYSSIDALTSIGLNAIVGGAIHGAIGGFFEKGKGPTKSFQPITTESDRAANEAAVNQAGAGKSVNVGDVVNQGYRDARLSDTQNVADLVASNEALNAQMEDLGAQLNSARESVNESVAENINLFGEVPRATFEAADIAERLSNIERMAPEELTDYEKKLKEEGYSSPEIAKAKKIFDIPEEMRSDAERAYIEDLKNGKEIDIINDRITGIKNAENMQKRGLSEGDIKNSVERATDRISSLERKVSAKDGSFYDSHIYETQNKIKDLERKLNSFNEKPAEYREAPKNASRFDKAKAKKEELEKSIKKSTKLFEKNNEKINPEVMIEKQQNVDVIRTKIKSLKEQKQNNQTLIDAMNYLPDAVSLDQIKANAEHMASSDSDSAVTSDELKPFQDEVEAIPDDVFKYDSPVFERIDSMLKKDMLAPEDVKAIENYRELEKNAASLKEIFKSAVDCLQGKL